MSEKNDFVKGLYIDKKDTQYGEIIKLSVKSKDFVEWLKANTNDKGYCNIDILSTRDGKKYAKKNEFKPQQQTEPKQTINITANDNNSGNSDNLPF